MEWVYSLLCSKILVFPSSTWIKLTFWRSPLWPMSKIVEPPSGKERISVLLPYWPSHIFLSRLSRYCPFPPRRHLFHTNNSDQGLFSENHEILPTSAGKNLYAGLVVLSSGLTYGLAGLLLSDELLRFFGVHWKNKGDGTRKGSNMNARSLDLNDHGDMAKGGQKIDREIPNGVGDIRRRFPSQRQNDRSARGRGRYHSADLERQS